MKRPTAVVFALFCCAMIAPIHADEQDCQSDLAASSLPRVPLTDVLDSVGSASGKRFMLDAGARPDVVLAESQIGSIDYASLLIVLRNNGLAAVTIGEVVNIVPVATVRQYPLPVIDADDASIADEEWVTRIVSLQNAPATMLVPIMRPLLPREGHLASNPASNSLVIVDRYANVQRLVGMIRELDAKAATVESVE